jgi:hypothetical protein
MLVADRAVLRGAGQSELARHLRTCADCRALASGIEGDTTLLGSLISGSAEAAMPVARRRRPWTALAIAALPVAATILIAVLFQLRNRVATPMHDTALPRERVAMRTVSVDVEPGQTATVIRTKDPNVTIVWISPGGTQ